MTLRFVGLAMFFFSVLWTTQDRAVEEVDLDALVSEARTGERDRWMPASERIGALAANNEAARQGVWAEARVNTLGMKFAEVPAGRFTMGPDRHRVFDVPPAHSVTISRGFFISVTEVTNTQFKRLFPKFESSTYSIDPDSPVTGVSWDEADRFCKALSKREGVRYRLPTEAEWEYACRGGSDTLFSFGDDVSALARFGWFDRPREKASRVALLQPNGLGVYDMHGNAVEWVSDRYSRTYYSECADKGEVLDPQGPPSGRTHVLRGGGWPAREARACSSTARAPLPLFDRAPGQGDVVPFRQAVGFRVARESEDKK